MSAKVKPVPAGYHSVTPYLCVKRAAEAISFYKRAFAAEEIYRLDMPDGRVGHAELRIGDSRIMLADEFPEMPDAVSRSPKALGGVSAVFCIYLEDVDARFQRAVDAGAKPLRPVENRFYGDRSGIVEDPFGHCWTLATHVEDVPHEELKRRAAALSRAS